MTASVVIPTRDKAEQLRLTLRCLARNRAGDGWDIVVVDDGCTDHTGAVLAEAVGHGLPVRVVRGRGAGRSAARNTGAVAATGSILIFLDDDILVPESFVAAHVAAHGTGAGYPDQADCPAAVPVGTGGDAGGSVVHGPLRELPRAAELLAAAPADPHSGAVAGHFGRTVRNALELLVLAMANSVVPPVAPWLACVGANVSLPRSLWQASGGFDESFGLRWGCEDLEYGYRLHAAGATMALAPAAAGVHLTHVRPDRWKQHTVNLDLFATRHPHPTVTALHALLAADGSAERYLESVQRLVTISDPAPKGR